MRERHCAAYRALARDIIGLRRRAPDDWAAWRREFCRALAALPPVGRTARAPEGLARPARPLFSDPSALRGALLALAAARDA